jgi:hypothetical protein
MDLDPYVFDFELQFADEPGLGANGPPADWFPTARGLRLAPKIG